MESLLALLCDFTTAAYDSFGEGWVAVSTSDLHGLSASVVSGRDVFDVCINTNGSLFDL